PRFLGVDAGLGRDAEGGEDVGRLRLVVRLPVAHLGVGDDAGVEAVCALHGSHRRRGGCWCLLTLPPLFISVCLCLPRPTAPGSPSVSCGPSWRWPRPDRCGRRPSSWW